MVTETRELDEDIEKLKLLEQFEEHCVNYGFAQGQLKEQRRVFEVVKKYSKELPLNFVKEVFSND